MPRSEWPRLVREASDLPPPRQTPTPYELATQYAALASAYYQQWPKVVDALEWLRAEMQWLRVQFEEGAMRPRAPSLQEIEEKIDERIDEGVEKLEEAVTGRLPAMPALTSERVRALAAEEIKEHEDAKKRAEQAQRDAEEKARKSELASRRWQLYCLLFGAVLTLVTSLLVWALTKTR
jgi:hypothetical protein